VSIGDSPAFGNGESVLKSIGIYDELKRNNIAFADFSDTVDKKLQCGLTVGIAREALEQDYFMNVPKLKAHSQMYITLAVKNVFGIVRGMQKSMLHMRHGGKNGLFSQMILDLLEILPAHHVYVDAITAMHRGGPIQGDAMHFGCLAFSDDPIALDTSFLHALELDLTNSPLWCEARKRNKTGCDIENISFPCLSPNDFHTSGFEPVAELSPIRFNPFRFVWGNIKRCSLRIVS